MSLLLDLGLAPWRVLSATTTKAVSTAEQLLHRLVPERPAAPGPPLLSDRGLPEGVPPAALQPEPELPAPAGWPFSEAFPRTCGTGRLADRAVFWTDWLYDDHGATGILVDPISAGLSLPRGTYTYPEGPAAHNGADIFRVGIGLTDTASWWRVDWTTLADPSVPIALFALDTSSDRAGVTDWPAGAGVHSPGIDRAVLVSGAAAWLIDLETQQRQALQHTVDTTSQSFVVELPRSVLEPTGTWTVRLAAGLANKAGDGFADVPAAHGALPGQPNVYNVAFRTVEQERSHLNFWSDEAQAGALAEGDVSGFALAVTWQDLSAGTTEPEPLIHGSSTRWYVSSINLGDGVANRDPLSNKPRFLGRVQPYSVCLPATYATGQQLPVTLLLHSLEMGQNQFAAIDPNFLHEVCDARNSIVVTPLARGPGSWYFDEGELDVWEVWARVAESFGTDPNRTVIAGYSMGGYAAYKLGLSYPGVFAKAVSLAGPPSCGVRLLPDVDIPATLDPNSHCAREGDTWRLLPNARWLPYLIEHGAIDELVPIASVLQQVLELDRLGYRYRFTLYPLEDHLVFALQDKFEDAVAHMGTGLRQADPAHITLNWYPALVRPDLGIGPHQAWWVSKVRATEEATARRGAVATVDARSYARPDPARSVHRKKGVVLHFDPTPGLFAEQTWQLGQPPDRIPALTLQLTDVASATVDLLRAGFVTGERGTVSVATNVGVELTLEGLSADTPVQLDPPSGPSRSGGTLSIPEGRHHISFG